MTTETIIEPRSDCHRYEAVVRISEGIAACREPEELATTLADEIGKFLHFDHLYLVVFKENSTEIEYHLFGKGPLLLPDLPIGEYPSWKAIESQIPVHTPDWDTEDRFPRFKEWAKKMGLRSGVQVPLTTPHRRLGIFGISRDTLDPFTEEDISILRLIGRVVAFALDDGLNLKRSRHQNDQLKLLLSLTNRITSNLELRNLLRAIAAEIRELMQCDFVAVLLPDSSSDKVRLYALDFPHGKGFFREEEVLTLTGPTSRFLTV